MHVELAKVLAVSVFLSPSQELLTENSSITIITRIKIKRGNSSISVFRSTRQSTFSLKYAFVASVKKRLFDTKRLNEVGWKLIVLLPGLLSSGLMLAP